MTYKWPTAMWLMLLWFVCSAYPQKQQALPNLTYAELIQNNHAYLGKTVRLKAVWRYGFEWTYLCTSECKDVEESWVKVLDEDDLCRGSKSKLKKMGKRDDNAAEVVVVGRLEEGSRYHFQFVISCVEEFKKLH